VRVYSTARRIDLKKFLSRATMFAARLRPAPALLSRIAERGPRNWDLQRSWIW
jgi:hypothetical protein